MTGKLITLLLTAVLCLGISTIAFAADDASTVASGACGDNLTWVLDEDGVLTISGSGDMYYFEYGEAPWYDYCTEITAVVVEDGVTSVSNCPSTF